MPPASARNKFIILYDLKCKEKSQALHTLSEIILYEQCSDSKNEYKLFLVNSVQKTLKHIDASVDYKILIEEIINTECGNSDFLNAIDDAAEELTQDNDKKEVITKQIVFITDLVSFEKPNNNLLLNNLIDTITNHSIYLYVIGVPININTKTFSNRNELIEWMRNSLEVNKENSNEKIMKKIIKNTPYSIMCNYGLGINLFHSFLFKKGKQIWAVPLSFGTTLHLNVSTRKFIEKCNPVALKATNSGSKPSYKLTYVEDQSKMIDIRDTVNGVIKHGKFIKIDNNDRFKSEGPRAFQVLLITEATNVPEYLFQAGTSYIVTPNQDQSEEYLHFINTLIDQLVEKNLYIIARRVYNKNNNPKFVALIPNTDYSIKCFLLSELPYADDIVHVYNEQNIKLAPKVEITEKIEKFLQSIDITNEKCKVNIPLTPRMMANPNSLKIVDKVEEKLIKEYIEEKKPKIKEEHDFSIIKNEWPERELTVKKEEKGEDDFDDVDDFNFD